MSEVPDETLEELEGSNVRPAVPEGEEDPGAVAEEPGEEPEQRAPAMGLSKAGAAFIARFEGLRLALYNDPVGHCTIGIGHLVHHGRCDGRASEAEFRNGITSERAFQLLQQDAATFARAIRANIRARLTQTQFDALCSWAFNCGEGVLRTSTLARKLNGGDYASVPAELARWDKAGSPPRPLAGLTRRRRAEGRLFAEGKYE